MTLARIIGLVLMPIGVVVAAWAFIGIMWESPDNAGWVAPGLALGIGGAMIIVGVRYILKPKAAPEGNADAGAEPASFGERRAAAAPSAHTDDIIRSKKNPKAALTGLLGS